MSSGKVKTLVRTLVFFYLDTLSGFKTFTAHLNHVIEAFLV